MATGEPQFTPIHTTEDRVEAELFRSTLEAEGLEVRVTGFTDAALLGAAPGILPITLSVKAEEVDRARALLDALKHPVEAEAEPPPEYSDPEPPETGRPRADQRRPYLAAGLTFFVPGGAHLYARRPWTAAVFALGWVGVIALAGSWRTSSAAGGLVVLLLAFDLIGGVRAARVFNRGVDASRGRQLALGVALVGVAVGLSQGGAAFEAMRAARVAAELEQLEVACTAERLSVTNRGSAPRFVALTPVRVAERGLTIGYGDQTVAVAALEARGPRQATLGPGQTLSIGLSWGADGTECRRARLGMIALRMPGACWVDYALTLRASERDKSIADGTWSCPLPAR